MSPPVLEVREVATQLEVPAPAVALRQGPGGAGYLLLVSLLAIGINSYHPYSEDGGIYIAGVNLAADPDLYGASRPFITAFSNLSFFSHCIASSARLLHLSLDPLLFLLQVATIWLMLYACSQLARRLFQSREAQWASICLVAVCFSVPVAGTALFIMDPYLTSRSFSTPLTLLAICACIDRKMFQAMLLLVGVVLFHPLMAVYAIAFLLMLLAIQRRNWAFFSMVTAGVVIAGAAVQLSLGMTSESSAYHAAVMTRSYFFLSQWQWYELFGLAAPLAILAAYSLRDRGRQHCARVDITRTCVAIGAVSILLSLLLVHPNAQSHLMAAMQPLRSFLVIYILMFMFLGGMLGELLLGRKVWRWAVLFLPLAASLGILQHRVYSASPQVEIPGIATGNGWNLAFLWIRSNTPVDAVVALDSDYIHASGEDAQGFRAIAERSSLADASKDGGAAAAFPQLAEQWMREQTAQRSLNLISDAERVHRLRPFNVSWIVLDRSAVTFLSCPFANDLVKVCRL